MPTAPPDTVTVDPVAGWLVRHGERSLAAHVWPGVDGADDRGGRPSRPEDRRRHPRLNGMASRAQARRTTASCLSPVRTNARSPPASKSSDVPSDGGHHPDWSGPVKAGTLPPGTVVVGAPGCVVVTPGRVVVVVGAIVVVGAMVVVVGAVVDVVGAMVVVVVGAVVDVVGVVVVVVGAVVDVVGALVVVVGAVVVVVDEVVVVDVVVVVTSPMHVCDRLKKLGGDGPSVEKSAVPLRSTSSAPVVTSAWSRRADRSPPVPG